jgi:hypothetical protein
MTYERDEVQRGVVAKLCEQLTHETQKLEDILLRQKLTLTLNLYREQLAGTLRPIRVLSIARKGFWPKGVPDDGPKGAA